MGWVRYVQYMVVLEEEKKQEQTIDNTLHCIIAFVCTT